MDHVGAERTYQTIMDKRIQNAMHTARVEAQRQHEFSDDEYAVAISMVLGTVVTLEDLQNLEGGRWRPSAALLWATAQVAGQPVSSLLGEMKLYDTDLPELRRRIEDLEADAVTESSLKVASDQ